MERNKILIPCGKVLNKEVDLGEPTSFLDHVYLGWTLRQCEISKDIVDNYRIMCKSRISAGKSAYFFKLYKVSTPCLDDHLFKEDELKSMGELSKVCSQIVLIAHTWHVLDNPIFYDQ